MRHLGGLERFISLGSVGAEHPETHCFLIQTCNFLALVNVFWPLVDWTVRDYLLHLHFFKVPQILSAMAVSLGDGHVGIILMLSPRPHPKPRRSP